MSIHLVGGGWQDEPDGLAYRAFVAEATERAGAAGRDVPRVAIIAVRDGDGDQHAAKLIDAVSAGGAIDAAVTAGGLGDAIPASAFEDVDGIVVGGGLTPVYRDRLEPHFDLIRALVGSDIPYLGFSAGSAITASRAIVGGWRIGGVEIAPEAVSEDLDELTVQPGIGLVDVSVDVHSAQWGALSRMVAAVEAKAVDAVVGIDENTVLIAGRGPLRVAGTGSVWTVTRTDEAAGEPGVIVRTLGA
ncbi:peptidase S51 [Microbacterium horticulturae]|uniref:Peptidase S51 n=1 Tax=Microbacterium horticulturae TaxID=3028316 RepID=A0ABY8BUG4_9MICO|nr:peptidase S51 [Microbacterium sp. KACC 23027]WEG07825.1 peptidase S51 [Microbacterium sp. KACC 23027]